MFVANTVAGRASEGVQASFAAANANVGIQASGKNEGRSLDGDPAKKSEKTSEEKMLARFPQSAKVGDLIGLPVLDDNDSTIGYVQWVVRTSDGKVQLIVPYRKWFGWARDGGLLAWGRRPIAVPIEVVAILGRHINAVDMDRGAFDSAPTWIAEQGRPIPPDQTVKIALGRR